ncbi:MULTISPECIES: molybdate ABC transporter substrate-binding protein [unclassified Solwaraspora]|uniref:molybdate ABC transporter substrate-binding protein n=1 Tax=unclassified Solwaraspora TaxID=2627926 RepID=UPI00259BC993|nr:molybdate ABC transporter substrate-binding protein [Solwaraspora sp. WMMA2056]WJK42739.1 molybdate ABC transporter substrate-binding protein [Solwaraspora sp. WMMA2056]
MRRVPRTALLAAAAALVAVGCSDPVSPDSAVSGTSSTTVTGSLSVLAAASLTDTFIRISADFEAAHPGVTVTFNFAGSSQLAQQITAGAPADVFAAASPVTMATVVDAGDAADEPVVFARNQLVIAVPDGNPDGVTGLADLTAPEVKVALCAEQVPCGAAARVALDAAGSDLAPVTYERDVRAALSKVRLGEVDAALVYRTDAASAADEVDAVEFAESAEAINDYSIVTLAQAANPVTAEAFVAYVSSTAGQAILAEAGFENSVP